eukprot:548559-Pleurochrysis_carterae.AAC.1
MLTRATSSEPAAREPVRLVPRRISHAKTGERTQACEKACCASLSTHRSIDGRVCVRKKGARSYACKRLTRVSVSSSLRSLALTSLGCRRVCVRVRRARASGQVVMTTRSGRRTAMTRGAT